MKGITALLLVALAGCALAKHPHPPQEVEEVDEVEASPILGANGCPLNPKVHWLTPNKFHCTKYFACVGGEKVAMSCPDGLHFNKDLQVCDYPWAAGCKSKVPEKPFVPAQDDEVKHNKPEGTEEVEEVDAVEALPILGANGCPLNPRFHWLTPNKFHCTKYFACVGGEKVAMSCPDGLHFNKDKQVCDYPWAAGCDDVKVPEKPVEDAQDDVLETNVPELTEEGEEIDAVKAKPILGKDGCPLNPKVHWLTAHKFDCSKYFACVWGEKVAMSCPDGLHFNKRKQVCDYPWAAGCHRP